MAANDSAMQQLAQTFANLAQSVSSASKALDLSDQDIAAFGKKIASVSFSKVQSGFSALAAKFSNFKLNRFDGVFSDIGSKISKSFSTLSLMFVYITNCNLFLIKMLLRLGKKYRHFHFPKFHLGLVRLLLSLPI